MDYFLRLAQRALEPGASAARPRVASRFEIVADASAAAIPDGDSSAAARPAMRAADRVAPEHGVMPRPGSSDKPGAAMGTTGSSRQQPAEGPGQSRPPAHLDVSMPPPPDAGMLPPPVPAPSVPSERATPVVAVTVSQAAEPPARVVAPDVRPAAGAAQDHSLSGSGEMRHAAAGEPVVRVSIGRIDVRAVMAATPPPKRASPAPAQASQSLEAYLRAGKGDRSKP